LAAGGGGEAFPLVVAATGVTSVAWNGSSIIETGWHGAMGIILQDQTPISRVQRRKQLIQLFLLTGQLLRFLPPGIRRRRRAKVVSLPVELRRRILRGSSYQKGHGSLTGQPLREV
jgi:hypothetical protein